MVVHHIFILYEIINSLSFYCLCYVAFRKFLPLYLYLYLLSNESTLIEANLPTNFFEQAPLTCGIKHFKNEQCEENTYILQKNRLQEMSKSIVVDRYNVSLEYTHVYV